MNYHFAVFIGRFQPLHIGHQHIIDRALENADRLIILVGSADTARSIRNPFTLQERTGFLSSSYSKELDSGRIIVRGISDRAYNDDAWIAEVQRIVTEVVLEVGNHDSPHSTIHGTRDFKIALSGYGKDGTSFYLKMFPEWGGIDIPSQYGTFNSTDIRNDYFRRSPLIPHDCCSHGVVNFLKNFRLTAEFAGLVQEREYVDAYKASWARSPYPPVFVTADAIVIQSGHILLIRRGEQPGKGQLAFPGGYVNQNEKVRAAAIRELREETAIADSKGAIPPAMLASFIDDTASRVFDAPTRSVRGRVITHAFLFRCPDRRILFKVKGSDDAASAAWYRLGDLTPSQFFEDHYSIIEEMVGL